MIVPMKKVSLLIYHREYSPFIESLRDVGVVHIHENEQRSAADDELREKLQLIKRVGEMKQRLSYRPATESPYRVEHEGANLLGMLEGKFRTIEQGEQLIASSRKELGMYELWGDFSPSLIDSLRKGGWQVRFFSSPDNAFRPEWEEAFDLFIIRESGGQKYFVVIGPDSEETQWPDADPFVFPTFPAAELRNRIKAETENVRRAHENLDRIAQDAVCGLEAYRQELFEAVDRMKVVGASEGVVDEKIKALEGWVPVDREQELIRFLESRDVYYEISRSTPEDDVPTQLKNNKFSKLFEPIGAMYSLPNYNELDLTAFFAPFFMLFFGLCMGDGGYGLLIFAGCLLAKKKMPAMANYLKLGQWLGISTMVVGVLTGSFFGIALDSVTWPWLQGVKQYFITEGNYGHLFGGYNPLMFASFGLGIIQILLGMSLNVVKITKQHGFLYAASSLGWILLLVALMIAFGLPALGVALPLPLLYLLYGIMGISALAIFFLNSPKKNIFINFGAGIWDSYNMATGLLGDILSYVRLFALGLTGSILGGVFNMIAFDMTATMSPLFRWILVLFILLVGHALNFAIAMIGAFVHPMRLTFVEFYKSAGFEGMGKKYTPFKRRVE